MVRSTKHQVYLETVDTNDETHEVILGALAVDVVIKSGTRPMYFRAVSKKELEDAYRVTENGNFVVATECSKQSNQPRLYVDASVSQC